MESWKENTVCMLIIMFKFDSFAMEINQPDLSAVELPYNMIYYNRILHIDGLVQERCSSIANALELHLSCTKPSIYHDQDKSCIQIRLWTQEGHSILCRHGYTMQCYLWVFYCRISCYKEAVLIISWSRPASACPLCLLCVALVFTGVNSAGALFVQGAQPDTRSTNESLMEFQIPLKYIWLYFPSY